MTSLRPTVTRRDPFAFTYAGESDDLNVVPVARHARAHPARPAHEPQPGSIFALWTMVLWAMAATATILSVVFFGASRNGLWLVALILYVAGIITLLVGWRRLS